MSATLSVTPVRDGWDVILDYKHGTTCVALLNPSAAGLGRQDALRLALATHLQEQQQCRCIRRLWKRVFGARLGEVMLVRGGGG